MKTILEAILTADAARTRELLTVNPGLIQEKDENGVPAMLLAAKTGSLELVRYIVEYSKANMDMTDAWHKNMLHYGAMSGSVEVCRYLVERVGLAPTDGDYNLLTPYEIAARENHRELEKYFETVTGAPLGNMYHNPVRSGFFPDPSIVRVGSDYYMVNSTFVYFPCIPVSHSTDLIHWHVIGHAITNPEWAPLDELGGGKGFWAPDISYCSGRFYITATLRLNDGGTVVRKQFIVSAERPEGPYGEPAVIEEDGIDPSLFTDDDGRRYMVLNRGARILELNAEATRPVSEAQLLYYGDAKIAPEGPHLLKKDGYYYLFLAEGGTGMGHRVTVARSKELKGVYEPCPYNPIMCQTDEGAGIQKCGHGDLVQTQNGEWYMVYLCGRRLRGKDGAYAVLGRETALDPVTWTADGWPIVNGRRGPSALQIKPNLPETIWESSHAATFTAETLFETWMFPRAPQADGYRIEDGSIILKGSPADLDSIQARNILLRRQTGFAFQADCRMRLPKLEPGQDAGMLCYYDENTWLKFALFCEADGICRIAVREKAGQQLTKHPAINWTDLASGKNADAIHFRIQTKGLARVCLVSADGVAYTEAARLEHVTYLSDEGLSGTRFTGAMAGMYAYGGEKELYVRFDSFQYRDC